MNNDKTITLLIDRAVGRRVFIVPVSRIVSVEAESLADTICRVNLKEPEDYVLANCSPGAIRDAMEAGL